MRFTRKTLCSLLAATSLVATTAWAADEGKIMNHNPIVKQELEIGRASCRERV